jgi:ribosomal protein S18 acetylase RimI-like enzyme
MQRYPPNLAPPMATFCCCCAGAAIAGGAFKRLDEHTAEFKRIWTHSQFRRQGLAGLVLQELERRPAPGLPPDF